MWSDENELHGFILVDNILLPKQRSQPETGIKARPILRGNT